MAYVLEHLGYGCRDSGLLFTLATQIVSMAIPIERFGSDDLKERYLRRLIDGSIISAHAISEPDAGSDATAMATTATEDGDSYVLNGKKAFCTSGPVADVITVYAKHGRGGRRDGHHRVRGRDRHARHPRRRADPEDGAEHVTDRRARVHRLPRAEGAADRQARRRPSSCSST